MKNIKMIIILFCILVSGCSSLVMPDLNNTSESIAIKVCTDNELIPTVVYEFSDVVEEGMTIKTDPIAGEKVKKNDRIVVYISKGPAKITSKDSRIRWWSTLGSEKDEWIFYAPYIENNQLKIDLENEIKSKYEIVFKDYGEAIVTSTTDINVPISITKGDKVFSLKEAMTLSIPLSSLNNVKPTKVKVMLGYEANGSEYTLNMEFTISW